MQHPHDERLAQSAAATDRLANPQATAAADTNGQDAPRPLDYTGAHRRSRLRIQPRVQPAVQQLVLWR
eukprot:7431024-Pyramimonas_sp.AAC.1